MWCNNETAYCFIMYRRQENLSINIRGGLFTFDRTKIMGIVNLTPDSFFAGSRYNYDFPSDVDMIDAGACSTRPGGAQPDEDEELARLCDGLPALRGKYPDVPLSLDTYRPNVARYAVEKLGVDIINDISGGLDGMFETVAELGVPYVLTYPGEGVPEKMLYFFSEKIDALTRLGVKDIILDPGFGFGKTLDGNYTIARNLHLLHGFGLPVLVGISRKSMIQKVVDVPASEALNGTSVLHTLMLSEGVDILRVHDVREAWQTIRLYEYYNR